MVPPVMIMVALRRSQNVFCSERSNRNAKSCSQNYTDATIEKTDSILRRNMNKREEAKSQSVLKLFRMDGKVSVITGGSRWLGYDAACALAEAGSDIIITSRRPERAQETAESIRREHGVDAMGLNLDQRFHEQVREMAQKAHSWKGHIDVLINNAGGGSGKGECNLLKRNAEDAIGLITTNLIGCLFCCQEVGRIMVEQRSGKIVNLASIAGIVGRDRSMYHRNDKSEQPIDYAAAKAGIIGMTRDLAALLSPFGVYVNAISPGGFDRGDLPESFVKDYSAETMLGRMGEMGVDLKGAILYLASAASDYVTGHNLVVDGGFSVWK
jgi:NAD(P)-dependent dehydrogenase (short-subunit alcohol dehydrogenase family)